MSPCVASTWVRESTVKIEEATRPSKDSVTVAVVGKALLSRSGLPTSLRLQVVSAFVDAHHLCRSQATRHRRRPQVPVTAKPLEDPPERAAGAGLLAPSRAARNGEGLVVLVSA